MTPPIFPSWIQTRLDLRQFADGDGVPVARTCADQGETGSHVGRLRRRCHAAVRADLDDEPVPRRVPAVDELESVAWSSTLQPGGVVDRHDGDRVRPDSRDVAGRQPHERRSDDDAERVAPR